RHPHGGVAVDRGRRIPPHSPSTRPGRRCGMTVCGAPAVTALLRHESRRCGFAVWALPLAGIVAGAAVVMVPPVAQPVLSVAFRVALAGFAALCVVTVLGGERMWQLHLSLP